MPIYHFNVYDGVVLLDEDGSELPDLNFARREAIRYAGALLEDGSFDDNFRSALRMEVTDGDGSVLFSLDFKVVDSSTTIAPRTQ